MNNKKILGTSIVIIVIAGTAFFVNQRSQPITSTTPQAQTENAQEGKVVQGYNGKVLAGSASPYLVFNKTDYEEALADNKIIFLDFFANWCPVCREEAPNLKAGFDGLQTDKVVGFRVNYNDTDTDEDEKRLAREFGVTYQHTKVILKNGKEVTRSLESWDKAIFLKTVNNLVN